MKTKTLKKTLIKIMAAALMLAVLFSAGTAAAAGTMESSDAESSETGYFTMSDGDETADVELEGNADVETGDEITDAVTADYIISNIDEAYTSYDFFELVNYLSVKQTIADGGEIGDKTTIEALFSGEDYIDIVLAVMPGTTAVYDLSEESDYFVSFANTMFEDDYEVSDVEFAVSNSDGELVEGCIYDDETGIVYIPKELYYDDDGTFVIGQIQAQFLQISAESDVAELESCVSASLEGEDDEVETGSESVGMFLFETTIETEAGIDESRLIVSVNGIPIEDYTYDSEAGLITVPYSSASVQSVSVKIEEETLAEKILDLFSPITVMADTISYGSYNLEIVSGTITFDSDPAAGTTYTGKMQVKYEADADDDETASATSYGAKTDAACTAIIKALSSSNYTSIKNYTLTDSSAWKTFLLNLNTYLGDTGGAYVDFSDLNKTLSLFCSHIGTSALGTVSNYIDQWKSMTVRARVLQVNTANQTVVLGFLTQTTNSQTGYGIVAFHYETETTEAVGTGSIDITKLGTDSSGNTITSSAVSRSGAAYTVYTDSACTTIAKKSNGTNAVITTNTADGQADAITMALVDGDEDGVISADSSADVKANTYYVRETSIASGYYLNTTVYSVNLLANGVSSYDSDTNTYTFKKVFIGSSDSTYTSNKVVYDQQIIIPFTIIKYDADDDSLTDFDGTVYTVYSSYQTSGSGDVKTDDYGQPLLKTSAGTLSYDPTTGGFHTLYLPTGTYYIKETSASENYETDTTVYKLMIQVTYESGYYKLKVSIYQCTSVSGSTINWEEYDEAALEFASGAPEDRNEEGYQLLACYKGTTKSNYKTTSFYSYDPSSGETGSAVSSFKVTASFRDDKLTRSVSLIKSGSDAASETPVVCGYEYDLAGAVYCMYTDEACTQIAYDENGEEAVFVTTASGLTNSVIMDADADGTYYIKEISASPGYLVSDEVICVELTTGENYFTVSEEVSTEALELKLNKTDSVTGQSVTSSSAAFKLVYSYQDEDGEYVKNITLYYQTDENGEIDFSDTEYLVSGTPYTNEDGEIIFYAGMITIEETQAPGNYVLDETVYEFYLDVDENGELKITTSASGFDENGTLTLTNKWQPDLFICKIDASSGQSAGSGFTFLLYTEDETIASATTDTDGIAVFKEVAPGTYHIREISAADGYILDETVYTVVVDEENKTVTYTNNTDDSSETVNPDEDNCSYVISNSPYFELRISKQTTDSLYIEGVSFILQSAGKTDYGNIYSQTGTTDENGSLVFTDLEPGTYYLIETDVSDASISVAEPDADSVITIVIHSDGTKTIDGETTNTESYYIVYNERTVSLPIKKVSSEDTQTVISGITFRLYNADDLSAYDRYLTTNSAGICTFTDLTPGNYILTETDAEDSSPAAIPDETEHVVVVADDGTVTLDGESVEDGYKFEIENDVYACLNIVKRDSYSYDTVKNVTFHLTGVTEETADYDETVTTDENGEASFDNLPPGTYALTETDVSDSILTSELTDSDASVPAVTIDTETHIVIVSDDGTVTVDGTQLNASFVYTQMNHPTKGVITITKKWITSNISSIYTVFTEGAASLADAIELPILHLSAAEN